MSATIIPLEEGWARLEAGLRRCEGFIDGAKSVSSREYSALYVTAYTMCTQKPPNNWSADLYQRYRVDAQQFSARAVARLAGKQGDQYVAALFVVWKSFEMYARFAEHMFKYLDRFYVKRSRMPEIQDVVSLAFSGALGLEATALSTGAEDRAHDIALLCCMQRRTEMTAERRVGPVEERWQACFAVQPAVASRRRALALMLVLCAQDPPRAELGDDPGRLPVVVRLAREGPFGQNGRSPLVELILKKVTEEGTRELVRAVAALLEEQAAETAEATAAATAAAAPSE